MADLLWNLYDDFDKFDVGESNVRPGVYRDRKALYLNLDGSAILLRDEIPFKCFRLQAEVAIPEQVAFIGLVFAARDSHNYELVYLAPEEIQYDPIMNDSMTWQIYHGSSYQKPLANTTGEWTRFAVEVQPDGAAVYLGENPSPQLVIANLQHGEAVGKIGLWSFLPAYMRNLSVQEIQPEPIVKRETDLQKLAAGSFVTEWLVSDPYAASNSPIGIDHWKKAGVEENGTLNINRLYAARQGAAVQAKTVLLVPEEKETVLTVGYSDHLRLWINEEEVYQGDWRWDPPVSDGRIRSDFASIPVRWRAGLNTLRAEITNNENFGWGLSVTTGLPNMSFANNEE